MAIVRHQEERALANNEMELAAKSPSRVAETCGRRTCLSFEAGQ
jgi:hypothetical protein